MSPDGIAPADRIAAGLLVRAVFAKACGRTYRVLRAARGEENRESIVARVYWLVKLPTCEGVQFEYRSFRKTVILLCAGRMNPPLLLV